MYPPSSLQKIAFGNFAMSSQRPEATSGSLSRPNHASRRSFRSTCKGSAVVARDRGRYCRDIQSRSRLRSQLRRLPKQSHMRRGRILRRMKIGAMLGDMRRGMSGSRDPRGRGRPWLIATLFSDHPKCRPFCGRQRNGGGDRLGKIEQRSPINDLAKYSPVGHYSPLQKAIRTSAANKRRFGPNQDTHRNQLSVLP